MAHGVVSLSVYCV